MDISAEIAAIQAASQGSELRQPLVGALNKLNSGSLPAVTASDTGKILKVGANGWEVGEKSGYMPVPSASLNITENGTVDVTNYAEAVVNVSSGGSPVLITKNILSNGTYNAQNDNADGYSSVTVNVSGGGGSTNILSGTSEPTSVQGSNGDIYLQYVDSDIGPEISAYKRLVSIITTGTQWIDTGFTPSANTKLEFDVEITGYQASSGSFLFGVRSGINFEGYTYADNNKRLFFRIGNVSNYGAFNNYGQRLLIDYDASGINVKDLSGTQIQNIPFNNTPTGTASQSMFLFTLRGYGNSTAGKYKLYSLKIYESGTLVRNFIPSYRVSDDVVGLYDLVNNVFYTNSGTGTFDYEASGIKYTYLKVSGAWQSLIGSDINDVNLGGA